jgi:hypothetical protein
MSKRPELGKPHDDAIDPYLVADYSLVVPTTSLCKLQPAEHLFAEPCEFRVNDQPIALRSQPPTQLFRSPIRLDIVI